MKASFLRNIFIYLFIIVAALPLNAKDVHIYASSITGDFTTVLRSKLQNLTWNDHVVLDFNKAGTYEINGTVRCSANIEIKGVSKEKTTIILNKGTDKANFKAFTDDTFLEAQGTPEHQIEVSIHDISIKLKDHQGIWWDNSAMYAVKIYHACKVNIEHVNSYLRNAVCTNFDLRVCSNVTIKGCNITNYNNCAAGGNIWIRGATKNVEISDNKVYKYGNDEMVAFFEATDNAHTHHRGHVTRENINVENNTFSYGYDSKKGKNDIINDLLFSFITVDEDVKVNNFGCASKNVRLSNNTFEINDPCKITMILGFTEEDSHQNIVVEDNIFENNENYSGKKYTHEDFLVKDFSKNRNTISINNNTVTNNCALVNSWGGAGNYFALIRGGNISMEGNTITDNAPISNLTKETLGTILLWCGSQGGSAKLSGNEVKGLKMLACVSEGDGIEKFSITAQNNYFEGDTRIYCNKVKHLDLNFSENTFVSTQYDFFLQEFANEGTLVFSNNNVTAQKGGQLMTHWSNTPLSSMRFTKLEVSGNTFSGVKQSELMQNIQSSEKRNARYNTFK